MSATKFHTHTEQREILYILILNFLDSKLEDKSSVYVQNIET